MAIFTPCTIYLKSLQKLGVQEVVSLLMNNKNQQSGKRWHLLKQDFLWDGVEPLYLHIQPHCPTAEKAFAGQGLPLANSPCAQGRAGWSWQSKKLHFKWLSGRQCQTFAEHVLRKKEKKTRERKTPPPIFMAIKIYLYTVYMLHKNANYSSKQKRNRAIFCIPPFPLHYPLYFYDAAFI